MVLHCKSQVLDTLFAHAKQSTTAQTIFVQNVDSTTLQQYRAKSIADVLQYQAQTSIKNYGANSLATASIRGSNASQIAVLWNGFNINMVSMAQSDFNLLPAFLVDEIRIQHSGNSAIWGSGDVGGAVHLSNKLNINTHRIAKVHTYLSGAQQKQLGFALGSGTRNQAFNTRVLLTNNTNDYKFVDPNAQPEKKYKRLPNAQMKQQALLHEHAFKFNKNNRLDIKLWLQNTERNLPPSIWQAQNKQHQIDKHARLTADWQKQCKTTVFNTRICLATEYLHFTDTVIQIDDRYHTQQVLAEAEAVTRLKATHLLNYSIGYNYAAMQTQRYVNNKVQQQRYIARLAYAFNSNKWAYNAAIRQEIVDTKILPVVAHLNAKYNVAERHAIKAALHTNYRIPTFNDMYWAGAGDPKLKPEQSFGQDLAYDFNANKNNKLHVGIYSRTVNNWIIWLPNANNIWQPQNIAKVWSRGLEVSTNSQIKIYKAPLNIFVNYAYTKSTSVQHQNPAALNKQLIYTPIHKLTCVSMYSIKQYAFRLCQIYTSQSFTSTDNSTSLDAFYNADISISRYIQLQKHSAQIQVALNNITNTTYFQMYGRPMPLRHLALSIQYQFTKQ